MSGRAAYKALIKSTSVAPIATVEEPMEYIGQIPIPGADQEVLYDAYRVINPLHRLISKEEGINFMDLGSGGINPVFVSWLAGIVFVPLETIFEDVAAASFSYYTTAEIVGANTYTLDIGGDILDDTNFKDSRANGGHRTKVYGLLDVAFSIERNSDYGQTFLNYKRNRERVLIEVTPGGEDNGPYGGTFRGWFVVESDSLEGDVGDLESESISFNLDGEGEDAFVFIPWEA